MNIHSVISLLLILPAFSRAADIALEAYKWQRLWYDNAQKSVNRDSLLPTSAVYYPEKGYLFIGIKRDCHGIPATLNVIDVKKHRPGSSPPLTPFPNYELNEIPEFPQQYGKTLEVNIHDGQFFEDLADDISKERRNEPELHDTTSSSSSSSSSQMSSSSASSSTWNSTNNHWSQLQSSQNAQAGQMNQVTQSGSGQISQTEQETTQGSSSSQAVQDGQYLQPGQYPLIAQYLASGQYPATQYQQAGQYPTHYPQAGRYPTTGQRPQTGQYPKPGKHPQGGHYPSSGQSGSPNPFFPPQQPNNPYVPPYKPILPQPGPPGNQWTQNNPGSINQGSNQNPPDYLTGSHPIPAPVPGPAPGPAPGNRLKSLISVSAMTIDKCERLWLMDSGVVRQNNKRSVIYRASLWIFDLTFGDRIGDYRVVRRVEIPREIVETGEGIGSITVDVRDRSTCDVATAYFTNFLDNTIAVYSLHKGDGWFFHHYSFKPDSQESQFSFDGFSYTAHHGINSITLGWRETQGYSTVFYQSFSSSGLYATSTSLLLDKSQAPKNYNRHDFKFVGYRGCGTRSPDMVFDHRYGVILFASTQSKSIRCWNVKKSLHPETIGSIPVTQDNNNQKSLSIDSRGDLWLVSNGRLQCTFPPLQGDRSFSSYIYRVNIGDAIRGTVCAASEYTKFSSIDEEGNQYIGEDPIEDEEHYKNHLIDYLTANWE
uniref:Putative major royal jelly protein n=1 Tax=Phlebotomus kandelakii TaxID=1109342 RepID=A0A6B2EAM1_9DIPT